MKAICRRDYVAKVRCRKRDRKTVVVWSDGKKRDVHEIRLVVAKVKFAKHIMVSASNLLACVTAAREDCTSSHSVG